jgi:hypothetical protein
MQKLLQQQNGFWFALGDHLGSNKFNVKKFRSNENIPDMM